jgi:voltage-gated potassium channel
VNSTRRVVLGATLLVIIIAFGVLGYEIIEGWGFLDSLYMTITTITTVGFNEVHPLSTGGRIFSIFLIVGGVGGALYTITGIVQYIVEGNIGTIWERRKMQNRINNLKGHFILCGFGRVGEEIARTFKEEDVPFIVIDNRPDCIALLEKTDYIYFSGDATKDDVLKAAGIERARALIAAVGTDTDNTYITLSARGLCPDLYIEARASSVEAVTKLERSGANRVILPHAIGGRRMAMLALRPAVVDFIDNVVYSRGHEMRLENVDIKENSRMIGESVRKIRDDTGVTTLAIQKKNVLKPNPSLEETIDEGDKLIVIGTKDQLASLEEALTIEVKQKNPAG